MINNKYNRGSVLLLVMVLMSFMSILIWALQLKVSRNLDATYKTIPQIKSRISANSALSYWLYYRKSGRRQNALSDSRILKKYTSCRVFEKHKNTDHSTTRKVVRKTILSRCSSPGNKAKHRVSLSYFEQNYSDYLISSLGDLILSGSSGDGRFFLGPIFAGRQLILKDGGHHFFVKPSWHTKALLVMKDIKFWDKWEEYRKELVTSAEKSEEFASLKEKKQVKKEQELIEKVSQLIEPIFIGTGKFNENKIEYPLTKVYAKAHLQKEWEQYQRTNYSKFLSARLPMIQKLEKVAYGPLRSYAINLVDEDYYFKSTSTSNQIKKMRFPNGHLLEKELIGVGNGISRSFYIPANHSPVNRVFMKDLSSYLEDGNLPPRFFKVHPVKNLEGTVGSSFRIDKNILSFYKESKKTRLKLPKSAFENTFRIQYRNPVTSSFSSDRQIKALYLGYLGKFRRLNENDFVIDRYRGEIKIMNPDLAEKIWVEVGTTDGVRRSFKTRLNFGEIVYLDGKTVDAKVVPGSVVFTSTPEVGQKIHVMILRPRIYAQESAPGYQVGIFIDKDVEAVALDLERLYPPPTYGLIISKVPLYIYGNARRSFTIICDKDVYLGDINENTPKGNFVSIISNGMIWGQRMKASINLNRVILLSSSDGLYLNVSNDPLLGLTGKTEKSRFLGSLFLQGTLKNLYLYPNMSEQEGYYYHPGSQADFNFFYDEGLQYDNLKPFLLPSSFRIISRQN